MEKKKIAIIGGGIAGLTFVRSLNSSTYECTIFEKKEYFGEIGAAISVFPNALNVIDRLGLLGEMLQKSGEIKKIYLKTWKGNILSKTEPNYHYPTLCMHRADLHKILLNGLNAKLYTDHELQSINHLEDGTVLLTFENGNQLQFDAVIGADGIHSKVRKYIMDDGAPIFRGYNIWRGVVKTDFDTGYGSETFGIGQRFGIVPIKNGYYGWWATCNENYMQNDSPETAKEKLLRLFGKWHDPIPELIEKTNDILKNSLVDRTPAKGWTKGNATLIGDAAHPTTPNLGQGGCIAIEGAFILAKSIEKYGLTKKAYDRYEELQFPRAEMINKESLNLGKMGQLTNPALIGLRNFVFKAMPSKLAIKMVDKFFLYKVTDLSI